MQEEKILQNAANQAEDLSRILQMVSNCDNFAQNDIGSMLEKLTWETYKLANKIKEIRNYVLR